ncbi:MAG: TlpA family protein disulfide reductase [Geobacter sp.]|nr:TlpA family protein disulfide reductase [Geobacter sp.]
MNRIFWMTLLIAATVASGCSKKEEGSAERGGGQPVIRDTRSPSMQVAPVEGAMAPDLNVPDLSGKEVRLSDLRGKVVLLNFWASWCPPCREEMPSMEKLNKAMAGKPFQMLAVSIDEKGKNAVEAYSAKSGIKLPFYLDTEGKWSKLYGTTGVPETFIIAKNGVILKKIIGGLDWSHPEVSRFLEDAMKQ